MAACAHVLLIQNIQCRPTGNKHVLVRPTLTRECKHKTGPVIHIIVYVIECFLFVVEWN